MDVVSVSCQNLRCPSMAAAFGALAHDEETAFDKLRGRVQLEITQNNTEAEEAYGSAC